MGLETIIGVLAGVVVALWILARVVARRRPPGS
jgi:hypothetical protein